ncbi:molybdate-anion transporter-like isoform X1 [Cucurbita pepo subsp. pepo]|uniref:molybdate-anion transporter-like isoform X1 n=1 Tax=Cucurbita pepo subsp. pepo TaxID=3664 RepID=UPI000C9D3604|nr:molybdate-anion transporter-like isoform X1 [Cucurbita pepo subsp. pepo]
MAVIIESSVWEPNPYLFVFIFLSCFFSIFLLPYASKNGSTRAPAPFDHGFSSSFSSFQWKFLLLYSLASVMEGLWSVYGEFELTYRGVNREEIVSSLCVGYAASLFVGTFLGVLSDLIGQKEVCVMFCIIHLVTAIWKRISVHPSLFVASIGLSLATSIFSFSFETWMVLQHEKQGHRQDMLSDTFWLMTVFESVSLIGNQMLLNSLVGDNVKRNMFSPSTVAVFLALICATFIIKGWTEVSQRIELEDYRTSFSAYIFSDKRIWLLAWAQASIHFSVAFFWILWAPTLVADGREVHLGLVYPCLLGSRILGSSLFPWLMGRTSSFRTEDCLLYGFVVSGLVMSIVAFDYQELGVLVMLFSLFHGCVGLILPSLARLRTMYVPSKLRGGMISLSLAPANAAILFFLLQDGYYRHIENSVVIAFAALSLFSSAGSMYALKRWGKHPYQNWQKQ